jgi:hypothetical protein
VISTRNKTSGRFLKKAPQKLFLTLGPCPLHPSVIASEAKQSIFLLIRAKSFPTPPTQTNKSFLLLFFKKEALAS